MYEIKLRVIFCLDNKKIYNFLFTKNDNTSEFEQW